jgi:hypothetical protein
MDNSVPIPAEQQAKLQRIFTEMFPDGIVVQGDCYFSFTFMWNYEETEFVEVSKQVYNLD